MLVNNRVIWDDNGTLRDISVNMSNFNNPTEAIDFVAAEDAIYLASDLPFNHRYFDVAVANEEDAAPLISIWNGTSWESAVDVVDHTALEAGVTLSRSGIISWVTDRNKTWAKESTTENMADLATLKIYDMYWVRLKFTADLTESDPSAMPDPIVGTTLRYVGHKFSMDTDLNGRYPALARTDMKTAFSSGKTSWHEQTIIAAEEIIKDLRKAYTLVSPAQLFNWEILTDASIHKTAEVIFNSFGDDYADNRDKAHDDYDEAMNIPSFHVDKNASGRLDACEKRGSTRITRA